jgi:RIO kinase 1
MEMITHADGGSAPGLGQVELSAEQAREYHAFLVGQVVRMLCAGLVHGDLSEFNVLVGPDGPVIIDLPQAVNAAGNNHARAMLVRDVNNISATLGRFAPDLLATRYAEEMWELFAAGQLTPETLLTGQFVEDESLADVAGTLLDIEDAREEAIRRQLGREAATES